VSGVPHDEQSKIFDRFQVSHSLACDGVGVLLCPVEEFLSGPLLHGLEHLEDADVVADDVEVAIVDQNLLMKIMQRHFESLNVCCKIISSKI